MGQDDGIVVDVGDPGAGRGLLGDLMDVAVRRQPGADVEELADARLAGQKRTARWRKPRLSRQTAAVSGRIASIFCASSRSEA